MDPPQLAALRREIQYHPELVKKLGNQMDDLPTTIGVIAGYLEIAMEGEYSFQDLMGACELITRKLYESRTSIVLTGKKGV